MSFSFQWDSRKATANEKKHGVTFAEATTVFDNPLAIIFEDEAHSVSENRELIIGRSFADRLLIVCFTELHGQVIRVISARRANKREQKSYEDAFNA
jgi:uncharacterized DUF497 family protein